MVRLIGLLSFVILAALTGCSPYIDDFQYTPRPAVAKVHPTGSQATVATAMASVIGVHREDSKQGIPESVEIRLRLEDTGSDPISFDPATLELTNGQLLPFPLPVVRAPQSITLDPMQSTMLTTFFPLPRGPEAGDLDSLVLRWIIQIKDQRIIQTLTFRRVYYTRYYYDPFWAPYPGYPPYFWYGGVVVIHRR